MIKSLTIYLLTILVVSCSVLNEVDAAKGYYIEGTVTLDEEWNQVVYLSHVEAFGRMHTISAAMIFDKAEVDSLGRFRFEGKYLLPEDNLYRIHVCKVGDPVSTIIVGGQENNHVNFAMQPGDSIIVLNNGPVFSSVSIVDHELNTFILALDDVVENYKASGMNTAGSLRMRKENAADEVLLLSQRSSSDFAKLFGAYTLLSRFESTGAVSGIEGLVDDIDLDQTMYGAEVAFMANFKTGDSPVSPAESSSDFKWLGTLFAALAAVVIAWWIVQQSQKTSGGEQPKADITQLSVQERKVFAMLTDGLSNKEISHELNIGINTVKSHVQRIYKKLDINSRREALDLKGKIQTPQS